jgi:hypothetical protein
VKPMPQWKWECSQQLPSCQPQAGNNPNVHQRGKEETHCDITMRQVSFQQHKKSELLIHVTWMSLR